MSVKKSIQIKIQIDKLNIQLKKISTIVRLTYHGYQTDWDNKHVQRATFHGQPTAKR